MPKASRKFTHASIEEARFKALIDDMRSRGAELPWVEFKSGDADVVRIGKNISAIANSSRLHDREVGYIVWGIDDADHTIVGTKFDLDRLKHKGQEASIFLATMLDPRVNFKFHVVDHHDGRCALLEIPAANHAPVKFQHVPYVRVGSSTTKLTEQGDREGELWGKLKVYRWEIDIAMRFVSGERVVELLDVQSYFDLLKRPQPAGRDEILRALEADKLIEQDVGAHWNITNLGAVLFARRLMSFDNLGRKALRIVEYDGRSRVKTKREVSIERGYASGFEEITKVLGGILPTHEKIEGGRRQSIPTFPDIAVRELVANALIHQDLTVTGTGPIVEIFEDRIEITNPGTPLIRPERFLDHPPRSRNEELASLMRRLNFCEERGSGIDKTITAVELIGLPPPDFRSVDGSTKVVLFGPRSFSAMTTDERVRACYQHTALQWLENERGTNASFRKRFVPDQPNSAQISRVFAATVAANLIKLADPEAPKSGYVPIYA